MFTFDFYNNSYPGPSQKIKQRNKDLTLFFQNQNSSQNIFIKCPNCHEIPQVKLNDNPKELVELKCLCKTEKLTYQDFMKTLSYAEDRKENTAHRISDLNQKNQQSILNCLCVDCAESSKTFFPIQKKKRPEDVEKYQKYSQCLIHPSSLYEFYCYTCKKNLCNKCFNDNLTLHKEHKFVKLSDLLTEKEVEELKTDLDIWNYHIKTDIRQKKDQLIYSLREAINNLEEEYNYWDEYNGNLYNILKILIKNYQYSPRNYSIIKNIKTNAKLNFKRCEEYTDEISLKNINKYINFFKTNSIINVKTEEFNLKKVVNIKSMNFHSGPIDSLLLLNDGRFSSCGWDSSIFIYNSHSYDIDIKIKEHLHPVSNICQLKNGILVSSSNENFIKLFELYNRTYKNVCTITITQNDFCHKIISMDHKRFCACTEFGYLVIWKELNNKSETEFKEIFNEKMNDSPLMSVIQLKNKNMLACVSNSHYLFFFCLKEFMELKNLRIPEIKCSSKNSLIEIPYNKLAIGYENCIFIISYETFQIESKICGKSCDNFSSFAILDNSYLLCTSRTANNGCLILIGLEFLEMKDFMVVSSSNSINNINFIGNREFVISEDENTIKIYRC